jgi:hypothetical protein
MSIDAHEKRSTARWWGGLVVAVVVVLALAALALIIGGFLRGAGHDEDEASGCDCPMTEAAVGSIDWAGTGDTPQADATALAGGGASILVRYGPDTDPATAFRSLTTRLGDAYGSNLETRVAGTNRVGEVEDPAGRWRLVFQTDRFSGDEFPVTFHVVVTSLVPDAQAKAALDGLAEAVGNLVG